MIKGLFLNGIHVNGAGIAVDEAVIFAAAILPDPAESTFPLLHKAGAGTQFTADHTAIERCEKAGEFRPYKTSACDLGTRRSDRNKKGCTREKTQPGTT